MLLPYFNYQGFAIFVLAFLAGFVAKFAGAGLEVVAFSHGALIFALDLGYRYGWVRPRLAALPASRGLWDVDWCRIWLLSDDGGFVILLPAWVFGLIYPPVFLWMAGCPSQCREY